MFKLGDGGPTLRPFQEFLNRKFRSYSNIAVDEKYGLDEARVVAEACRRYGLPPTSMSVSINGVDTRVEGAIATDEFLARAGYHPPVGPQPKPLGTLFTVHGTGVADPFAPGLPADTARHVEHLYNWQPIGNYPAQSFPMWSSIQLGVAELKLQINTHPGRISMAGYSQGAIVVGQVLKHSIMDPAGELHHRLGDVHKVVFWGNPMRQQGVQTPDNWMPVASPDTAGILEDRLEGLQNAPFQTADYAHDGDMYASCPLDEMGENERAICKIIMGNKWWQGRDSIISQVMELLAKPFIEATAMVMAMLDAGLFFGSGIKAHGYDIGPAIGFLAA